MRTWIASLEKEGKPTTTCCSMFNDVFVKRHKQVYIEVINDNRFSVPQTSFDNSSIVGPHFAATHLVAIMELNLHTSSSLLSSSSSLVGVNMVVIQPSTTCSSITQKRRERATRDEGGRVKRALASLVCNLSYVP